MNKKIEESKMLKYKYVTVERKTAIDLSARFTEHREIIDEYANKGYKYIGYIPTDIHANGKIKVMDLIFESTVPE